MKKLLLLLGAYLLAATPSIHSMERVPHLLLNQVNSRLKTGARAIWRNRNAIGYAACTIASSHVLNQGLIACLEGRSIGDVLKIFCAPHRLARMVGLCALKECFLPSEVHPHTAWADHYISSAVSLRHFCRVLALPRDKLSLGSFLTALGSYYLGVIHIHIAQTHLLPHR